MKFEHDFEEELGIFLIMAGKEVKGTSPIKFLLLSIECV
jgi:hypothetical protein